MSDTAEEKEPSIDEILASIRQIISDDEEEASARDDETEEEQEEVVAAPEPEPQPEEPESVEEDVLELTEKVEDDESDEEVVAEPEPEPEPLPEPEPEPEPVEENIEVDMQETDEPSAEPQPEPESPPIESSGLEEDLDTEILTQSAAAATLAGFTKLARDIQVNRSYEGVTLEDIVCAQLEPLLREWLDKNLPAMIERLVQEELEKISKQARGE